jgi:uncharacterized protein (DUF433 family)
VFIEFSAVVIAEQIYQQFGLAVPARQNEDAIFCQAKLPRYQMTDTLESGGSMEDYVERREGGYYIAGTRISLDCIVHPFKNGASPEGLLRSFPLIGSLERVYGLSPFIWRIEKPSKPTFLIRSGCRRSWRPNNRHFPRVCPRS